MAGVFRRAWFPPPRKRRLAAPASTASVSLSGLTATGAIGTPSITGQPAVSGLTATGSIGTPAAALGVALSGLSATGSVAAPAEAISFLLPSLSGTGVIGSPIVNTSGGTVVALTGLTGTGAVGSLAGASVFALSGIVGLGAIGAPAPGVPPAAVSGLIATGLVGLLSVFGLPKRVWWSVVLTASGTYNYQLSNSDIVLEAFARIQLRAAALNAEHIAEAMSSLNLELQDWVNRGVPLWAVVQAQIALVAGQATYTLPSNCIELLDVWYSIPFAGLGGGTTDRILLPISRDDYASYPNKTLPGTPTVFWMDRLLSAPTMTIWQPDATGPPNVINYYYMRQLQDAVVNAGQTCDVPNRFLDALASALARRLARKYAPQLVADLTVEAKQAWDTARAEDRELAPIILRPNLTGYWN